LATATATATSTAAAAAAATAIPTATLGSSSNVDDSSNTRQLLCGRRSLETFGVAAAPFFFRLDTPQRVFLCLIVFSARIAHINILDNVQYGILYAKSKAVQ